MLQARATVGKESGGDWGYSEPGREAGSAVLDDGRRCVFLAPVDCFEGGW